MQRPMPARLKARLEHCKALLERIAPSKAPHSASHHEVIRIPILTSHVCAMFARSPRSDFAAGRRRTSARCESLVTTLSCLGFYFPISSNFGLCVHSALAQARDSLHACNTRNNVFLQALEPTCSA